MGTKIRVFSSRANKVGRLQYRRLNLQPADAAADVFFRQLSVATGLPRTEVPRES